jgi:hypothetical protein
MLLTAAREADRIIEHAVTLIRRLDPLNRG